MGDPVSLETHSRKAATLRPSMSNGGAISCTQAQYPDDGSSRRRSIRPSALTVTTTPLPTSRSTSSRLISTAPSRTATESGPSVSLTSNWVPMSRAIPMGVAISTDEPLAL